MRIYSMTATFGKLEHATLTLEPGLNIIEAPNEWGKSTWCAFLAAMLYGIDSRAHSATKQGLADKTRFDPWSGQLMSGRMELSWNGRDITIERTSTKRAAFRQFNAYETQTGLPVPELTGDNCGQMLLGVEKEVFQRAGFIRLSDMPVTQNDALRRRLNALVTTGDESGTAHLLAQQLSKLKNECRVNRAHGLLPQAEARRDGISGKLRQLSELQSQAQNLADRQAQLERQQQTLLQQQKAQDEAAARHREELNRLQAARQQAQTAYEALTPPAVSEPFRGLSPHEGRRMAAKDREVYDLSCKESHRPVAIALSFLPALLGLLCLLIPHWVRWVLCLGGLVAAMLVFGSVRAGIRRAKATVKALQEKYDSLPPQQWEETIHSLLTQQQEYETNRLALEKEQAALSQSIAQLVRASHDPRPISQQLGQCTQQLQQLHLLMGRCQGQMEALGQADALRAQLEEVNGRIRQLNDTLSAIELAQQTLAKATAQLQSRFAPRITQRASELFSRFTDGRYQRLSLTEDLTLHTCTESEDTLRSVLWRSEGTADQLYLALRLAVASELTPHAPLVLDDALVRFDDSRLKAAMEVLREEARHKQVILFTCQGRERNL